MDNKTLTIARRIKELLIDNKWSQAELSRRSGVTQQTLTNIMQGKTIPKDVSLDKIAETFGVYKEYLTGETPYKNYDYWNDLFLICEHSSDQDRALFDMLKMWGYEVKDNQNYGKCEVICPNGEKKLLCKWHLEYLLHSFFAQFESYLLPANLVPNTPPQSE